MYTIYEVPQGAAESMEQLGTKYKFWFRDPNFGVTLFKEGRPGTGENWAEKIAFELAKLLDMPHAVYELARFGQRDGVISPSLVGRGARLVHGNELLVSVEASYGANVGKVYKRNEHTLGRVLSYLKASANLVGAPYGFRQTVGISSALDVFVGYLMFDAFIANQDRHDQNWALLNANDGNSFLSPSFDHGSSMGRNESDERREIMMTTKDNGRHISTYVTRAKSALFPNPSPGQKAQALLTLDAFTQAARQSPKAANEWQLRLAAIAEETIAVVVNDVPVEIMSPTAKEFTHRLLCLNRARILRCNLNQ